MIIESLFLFALQTLYSSPSSCKPTIVNSRPPEIRETKMCSQKTDCLEGEYCHPFQCLCLKPLESVTIAPLTTSTRKCKDNSNCKNQEYCHEMWKICLQTGKFFRNSPPERPSWYCESNKDCRLNQQCHKIFHACYKRPRAPTVRRSASNSRKCTHKSQCGHNYYCHEFFRICLPGTTTNKTTSNGRSNRSTTCHNDGDCRAGMMCHGLWKICFTPAQNLTVKLNTKRGCQHDSDCPKDKYCHVMGGQVRAVIARHRRNLHSICLPRYLIQIQKSQQRPKCSTDAECGPNKCCLEKLGICSSYQLPGDMCLLKKVRNICFVEYYLMHC